MGNSTRCALLAYAERAQRVLFPIQNYKHAPVIRRVSELVASGCIGDVHHVTLETFRATHARGVPEWNTHWRRQRKYAGGGIAMVILTRLSHHRVRRYTRPGSETPSQESSSNIH